MWHRGIPPWHGAYDTVTISDEAKRRFQKMVDEELESRKPMSGEAINVKIEEDEATNQITKEPTLHAGVSIFLLTVTLLLVYSVVQLIF